MIRLLPIPVAGTLAALVVILLAHPPREGAGGAPESPPFHVLPEPEPGIPPVPEEEEEGTEAPPRPPPEPEERQFHLELRADGSFIDLESGESFPSEAELARMLGEARHTLVVANGEGVAEEALDQALARLRDRYLVRKAYRARETHPEAQPKDPENR